MATASEASQQANRSGMDPKRLVVVFYLVAAIVVALFLEHLLAQIWGRFGLPDPEVMEGLGWRVTTVLGVLLSFGGAVAAFVHPASRALSLEVASELMKVTWPSWSETRISTFAVVMASLLSAVILFGIDTLAYKLMLDWIPSLWRLL